MSLIREEELPATRLELRWGTVDDAEYPDVCEYNLVLELWGLDIRGEVYDDKLNLVERKRFKKFELGRTKSRRSWSPLDLEGQKIDTPFRDGSHIKWDALRLGQGVPAFVVCDGWAMPIDVSDTSLPDEPKEGSG